MNRGCADFRVDEPLSRRSLLKAGRGGVRRPEPAAPARGPVAEAVGPPGPGQARHLPPPVRRPVAHRHVRHEARRPGRHPRRVQADRLGPAGPHAHRAPAAVRARCSTRFAQVRSVHHRMKNHNSATYYSLTGHAPPLDDIRLRDTQELYPAYGSTVARFRPVDDPAIPTFVSFPHVLRDGSVTPGQTPASWARRTTRSSSARTRTAPTSACPS